MQIREYREIIDAEFTRRRARNQNYSLRAFARDLTLSPSQLSEILSGKRGLAASKATFVAKRLLLDAAESDIFELSVIANHHRSPKQRKLAKATLLARGHSSKMTLEAFKVISDWYHFAILEALRLGFGAESPKKVAEALGITLQQCRDAISRMIELGLIQADKGMLKKKNSSLFAGENVPSSAVRNFHRQVISIADRCLDDVPLEEREFQSLIVSFPRKELPKFKKIIRDFAHSLNERAEAYDERDEIYSISIQMVPLIKKEIK